MYASVSRAVRQATLVSSLGVVLVTGAAAVGCSWISGDRLRYILQAVAFSLMIAYILVPISIVLAAKPYSKDALYGSTAILYLFCVGLTVAGAVISWLGMPERFYPGDYDFFGASHQILHVAIVFSVGLFHFANVRIWNHLAFDAADKVLEPADVEEVELEETAHPAAATHESGVAEGTHERYTDKYGLPQEQLQEVATTTFYGHESPFDTAEPHWDAAEPLSESRFGEGSRDANSCSPDAAVAARSSVER